MKTTKEKPRKKSYGVILFTEAVENSETLEKKEGLKAPETLRKRYLLMKKRDTYAYVSILRGLWKDKKGLYRFFSKLTKEEQERILENDFDTLWDDMWMYQDFSKRKDWYLKSKKKFQMIESSKHILKEIYKADNFGPDIWEFPKGKKNGKEAEKDCALREFYEETTIPTGDLKDLHIKVLDSYKGTDRLSYHTDYFVFSSLREIYPLNSVSSSLRTSLSEEAGVCEWLTLEECKKLIDPKRLWYLSKIDAL
jgi:8-oxo-dGTP pyrophosphatase MutT (NUDIX family)